MHKHLKSIGNVYLTEHETHHCRLAGYEIWTFMHEIMYLPSDNGFPLLTQYWKICDFEPFYNERIDLVSTESVDLKTYYSLES